MKKYFYFIFTLICFFVTTSAKSQVIVTEFVRLGLDAEVNLKSKSVEAFLASNTGIKDLEWDKINNTLAITFDPRKTQIEDILRKIAILTNNNISTEKPSAMR